MPSSDRSRSSVLDAPGFPWVVIAMAAVIQLWLWSRSWLYHDQVLLYRLATDLVPGGILHGWAKEMSGGAMLPGSLLQIVLGVPLLAWMDFRAPPLALTLGQVAVLPLVYSGARELYGRRVGAMALLLFALSPWRLYHSGFLWEPNYLLILGPVHFWACVRVHRGGSLFAAGVLGSTLTAAPQLHPSGIVLGIGTVLLLAWRWLGPRWWALAVGMGVGASSLIPTASSLLQGRVPQVTASEGWLNLVKIYPLIDTFHYWLRMGSSDMGRRLRQATELASIEWVLGALGIFTILLSAVAHWRLWRDRDGDPQRREHLVVWSALLGVMAAHAVMPLDPQGWYFLVALHVACLPVAIWLLRLPLRWRTVWLTVLLVTGLGKTLVIGLGHPMYQRPDDPAALERVAPENLPRLEPVDAPFGRRAGSSGG